MDDLVFKSERLFTRLDTITESQLGPNVALPSSCATAKTKLDSCLPTFKGNIFFWAESWDLFSVAVHDNPQYSPVEKFVHLRGHLDGEATKCLCGSSTTNDNYDVAVNLLKQRFGNETRQKESLMATLLDTSRCTDSEYLRTLRGFVDELIAKGQGP